MTSHTLAMRTLPLWSSLRRCSGSGLIQSTEPPSSEKEKRIIDLLSDTKGFDLRPYLNELVGKVRMNWFHLTPESAERTFSRANSLREVRTDSIVAGLASTAIRPSAMTEILRIGALGLIGVAAD